MSYYLDAESYTWKNALLWGNSKIHFSEGLSGKLHDRIVHWVIALSESSPVIGQIISIAEKILFSIFATKEGLRQYSQGSRYVPHSPAGTVEIQPEKPPSLPQRPPFPVTMNREVLTSRTSDHSVMLVETPEGPVVSANVMGSGEDYDPNRANAFCINPYTVEGRKARFEWMVVQLKAVCSDLNSPVIALQEFPKRIATGSKELEGILKSELPGFQLIFGNKERRDHDQSQLCFLVPKDLFVEQFDYHPRVQAIRINNTAYVNIHPGPNRSKRPPDRFQEQLKSYCDSLFRRGCESVHIIGDWNRNRKELEYYWEQISSAGEHSHYPPAIVMEEFNPQENNWPRPIDHHVLIYRQV